MSTNYYLINKKDAEIKQSLSNLTKSKILDFKESLTSFSEENNLYNTDFEENIDEKLHDISCALEYGLFKPEEIHICGTRGYTLTWQITEYWKDEVSFIKFYMDNIDKYRIENEYKEEFLINDFLIQIHESIDTVKYLHEDFA